MKHVLKVNEDGDLFTVITQGDGDIKINVFKYIEKATEWLEE